MFTQWKIIAATLTAAALLSAGAQPVLAQNHDHSHGTAGPAQLTLNNGQKWATDDNLRQGMSRIRDALAAELPVIQAGKATMEQYRTLAQKTNDQIAFMVLNCKLSPDADAMLHLILADIIAGADAMKGGGKGNEVRKGAENIAHALDNYETYFDHPGWHGVTFSRSK
ncbi:hypothetical protein SCD_n00445 [Sulfuricella denitrificans skB26]|uniref:DnrO protein n=1 Tax=Sulfuricella denitrificans (strain DSM 22764 / NBRC 105220 / skB26) TaxID=1163617 RepID=S6AIF5_SULDS|nr:hypothetical protein [Sulfuricella denitrificans]BAN34294.1 hypothetical protein SCD_n00445 [Sulfuricella denitrificans skB26]